MSWLKGVLGEASTQPDGSGTVVSLRDPDAPPPALQGTWREIMGLQRAIERMSAERDAAAAQLEAAIDGGAGGGRSMTEAVMRIEPQTPAPVESAALVHMIERAARDPSIDMAKMERLFEMHERVAARAAERAFNTSMSAAQAELIPVARRHRNTHTNSMYADIAAIAEAAMPVVHQHGFGLSFSEFRSELPDHLGVACEVTHAGGHCKRYEFNVPIDAAGAQGKVNKTRTQAYGSTATYGRRYATCMIFNVATKNDVDGNAAPQAPLTFVSPEQQVALKLLIDETNTDIGQFLTVANADTLGEVLVRDYTRLHHLLARKKAKMSNRT